MHFLPVLSCLLGIVGSAGARLAWNQTEFLFIFGDSYTSTGFDLSNGVDSVDPGQTSSNGPNWVQVLDDTYNVAGTKIFNMAFPGVTIDAGLVAPHLPTTLSMADQVAQFNDILAPKPIGAQWNSSNALFAVWIGINDCIKSFNLTSTTQPAFNEILMARLTTLLILEQVEEFYSSGARSFLFLTVPPISRTPRFLAQGSIVAEGLAPHIADYNTQLSNTMSVFEESHENFEATVFDSQPIFNTLLDNAEPLGFFNSTGYCGAYLNGTSSRSTEIPPCSVVSTYFWLNDLHPMFTVHEILVHALATVLVA
ncbi:hypothetical protein B0H19DRAFT_1204800 [Mycena capillaripes]|nr:hypothetical protein B0H19DRAFT_1204800 [Mycena capillaripes]